MPQRWGLSILGIVLFFALPVAVCAQQADLTLIVSDGSGARISGAQASLTAGGGSVLWTMTGADGSATLAARPSAGDSLLVSAAGFATYSITFTADTVPAGDLSIFLEPAPVSERVVVSATRTESRLGDTAASVVALDARRLEETAALALDDKLRQVPGFSLFRRSGSRTLNPTTQGVSLRGTGASGASRALVLEDGVPLNDPFGGWVYWNRVPNESIRGVEIFRGGASSLYGSGAIGGVMDVLTRRAGADPMLSLSLSGGSQTTVDASGFAADTWGRWSATVAAQNFATDGYIPVDKAERGPIDSRAASRNSALEFTLARSFRANDRVFARASVFGESRLNGTPLQINRTHLRNFVAGADLAPADAGSFVIRLFGGTQVFDQTFTAVNTPRTAETITRLQRSPSQFLSLSFQWSRAIGDRHALVAGVEARAVRGSSDEIGYTAGFATSLIGAGGREQDAGVFVQDVFQATSRLTLTGGIRYDRWRNYQALTATSPLLNGGPNTLTRFPDRDESAVSPYASLLYKISRDLAFNASITRAFRAPTLNELYRSFRVGNVLTLANENLRAERSTGGEAGLSFSPFAQRLFVRGNVFWTEITRPVANVTLGVTSNLTTRQRRNLGRTRSAGIEVDLEAKVNRHWTISAGYLFAHATVLEFPANPSIEGLWVPQVARQQLSFQITFRPATEWTISAQGRFNGQQFEDDQNLLRLEPFFTLDAYAGRRIGRRVEIFAAGENLTNQRYSIGRTPVRTVAAPLGVRAGIKLSWGN
jgi:outer membrane receptor protein involved in Fe transport